MKYYSDITRQFYETAKGCKEAEDQYKQALAEKEANELKLKEEKANRAKEVEAAYQAVLDAQKHYNELKNSFIKDYKTYHMTYSTVNDLFNDITETFFKVF